MSLKNIFWIFLLLVAAQSVFSQDALTNLQSRIEGDWVWVRTEPTDGSVILTPDLCTCSKSIQIQREGTYAYLEDDQEVYQGPFTLLMSGGGPSPEKYFFMGNHFNLGMELTTNDELLLGSFSSCKGVMVFKRVKRD